MIPCGQISLIDLNVVHDAVPDLWLLCRETMQSLQVTSGQTFKHGRNRGVRVNNSKD